MALLARREHSARELEQKLRKKGWGQEAVSQIVDALVAEKLLSDERFTEMLIGVRRRRGFGPLRIQQELQEKGVDPELIHNALDFLDPIWLDELRELRQKKFGAKAPGDFAARAKQMRFLQYRGFTLEQIQQVLNSRTSD